MEVFGRSWQDYMTRIEKNWRRLVTEEDTVIVPGDVSWALSLEESESDFRFLESLPGKKILGKGNHDFWWCTMKKHEKFFESIGVKSISFLFNNAHSVDDFIIAGTRGWYNDEDARNAPDNTDFQKLTNREALRLRASLTEALKLKNEHPEKEIIAFMHFPPYWNEKASDSLIEILKEFDVKRVYYGHIHGNYAVDPTFVYDGIEMNIISADYLGFIPKHVERKNDNA